MTKAIKSKRALQTIEMKNQSDSILSVISKAAADPKVDVNKMTALLDMQERIMAKNAEMAFNQAMTRLQKKLPSITKHGKIEFTDKNNVKRETPFARYEDIDAAIRPLMIAEDFSISFNCEWGEAAKIIAVLSHSEGHSRKSEIRLPLDTSGSKNNLQAMGSTLSYGKRYLVGMLLNIITKGEDDDALTGGGGPAKAENPFAERVKGDAGKQQPAKASPTVLEADYQDLSHSAGPVYRLRSKGVLGSKVFDTAEGAAHYLKSMMEKRNHKKSRTDLIAENAELVKALADAGNVDMIKSLHALADKGAE